MASAADLEDIDQRALCEGDGVLELEVAQVVRGKQVVKLRKNRVELSKIFGCHSDKLVALLDVVFTVFVFQVPLDLHQENIEVTATGLHFLGVLVKSNAKLLLFRPVRAHKQGNVLLDLGLKRSEVCWAITAVHYAQQLR